MEQSWPGLCVYKAAVLLRWGQVTSLVQLLWTSSLKWALEIKDRDITSFKVMDRKQSKAHCVYTSVCGYMLAK